MAVVRGKFWGKIFCWRHLQCLELYPSHRLIAASTRHKVLNRAAHLTVYFRG